MLFSSVLFTALDASAGDPLLTLGWSITADQVDANIGTTVSTAGDVNGDGFGMRRYGCTRRHEERGRQRARLPRLGERLETAPAWAAVGDDEGAYIMGGGKSAGDVNGDGYGDMVVGARSVRRRRDRRKAVPVPRVAGGLDSDRVLDRGVRPGARRQFAKTVASAGDVNGDGYDDVVVGALLRRSDPEPRGPGVPVPRLGRGTRDRCRRGPRSPTRTPPVRRRASRRPGT